MSKIILLTGATGFVGQQVLRFLRENSVSVRLVVRDKKKHQIDHTDHVDDILVTSDLFLETDTWWRAACEGIDTVIHLAWYAEPGNYLQSPINIDCLAGTLALAKACTKSGVRRFVGVGTCFEYDLSQGYLSIDTPLKPDTPYAAAKVAAYFALSKYMEVSGINFAWCRLFYLYGEGEDHRRLVPYLRAKLEAGEVANLTGGNQVRDFLNVKDAGRMIVEVALGTKQGPINVCSGSPITVRQLSEKIAAEYGRLDLLRFGTRPDNLTDPPVVVGVR
jgi:dTDP-6-deoxy-L-talose 4-dehydrogenase (NAD+)